MPPPLFARPVRFSPLCPGPSPWCRVPALSLLLAGRLAETAGDGGTPHQADEFLEAPFQLAPLLRRHLGFGDLAEVAVSDVVHSAAPAVTSGRSEERRVGKECGSRLSSGWWPVH